MRLKPYTIDEHGIKDWNPGFLLIMPLLFTALLIFFGGSVIGMFEIGAATSPVKSTSDAHWLAMMAASTVGFGDVYPMTFGGRCVVGAIAVLGICAFNAIGTFVSLWIFSRFDTEVQNRVLRAQNAEIISSNNKCIEYLKEVVRTNNLSVEVGEANRVLNEEIAKTNIESVDGNAAILVKLEALEAEKLLRL